MERGKRPTPRPVENTPRPSYKLYKSDRCISKARDPARYASQTFYSSSRSCGPLHSKYLNKLYNIDMRGAKLGMVFERFWSEIWYVLCTLVWNGYGFFFLRNYIFYHYSFLEKCSLINSGSSQMLTQEDRSEIGQGKSNNFGLKYGKGRTPPPKFSGSSIPLRFSRALLASSLRRHDSMTRANVKQPLVGFWRDAGQRPVYLLVPVPFKNNLV